MNNVVIATVGCALVMAIGIGGLAPQIQAIRSHFGKAIHIRPYRGPWLFTRPQQWYFTCFQVTDTSGDVHAVLTLGAEVKEVLPFPAR